MSSPFCDVVGCRRPSVEDCPAFGTSYCVVHLPFHFRYQCSPGHPSLSTGNGGSVAQGFVPQLVATGGNGHSSLGMVAPVGSPVPPNGGARALCGIPGKFRGREIACRLSGALPHLSPHMWWNRGGKRAGRRVVVAWSRPGQEARP